MLYFSGAESWTTRWKMVRRAVRGDSRGVKQPFMYTWWSGAMTEF